jgi:hypothetical protein
MYKVISLIAIFFLVLGLLEFYRFMIEFKKLDKNKTVEEVGLEKMWERRSTLLIIWTSLGGVLGIAAILLH